MDIYRGLLIVFLGLFSGSVIAEMYKWVDEQGNVTFSDRPQPGNNLSRKKDSDDGSDAGTGSAQDKVNRIQAEIKRQFQAGPTYPDSIVLGLRERLKRKQFDELNRLLAEYQQAVEEDITKEESLFAAYATFDIEDESYAPLFDAWQQHSAELYQPYLARAFFNYRLAWKARGGKWASETSEKQFEAMNAYFTKVTADLNVVFNKTQRVLPAYSLLIGMMSTGSQHERMYQIAQSAIAVAPGTYRVRARLLMALSPRWGGSYETMQALADEAKQYYPLNPKLKLLQGQVIREAADMKVIMRSYNAAEKLYHKALQLGEEHTVIYRLGKNSCRQEKYHQAVEQLTTAIRLYHEDGDYYYWRAKAYAMTNQYKYAVTDIERAVYLKPGDEGINKRREWLASRLESRGYDAYKGRRPGEAVSFFKLGLRLAPDDAFLHYRLGRAYIDLQDLDAATVEVKKAIELNPDEYSFYKLVDWLLFKKRDMDQIIAYWDQYIELHPDDSNAYVERGGAYFHKGDLRASVRDAKTAADMGNIDGREAYERYKDQVQ